MRFPLTARVQQHFSLFYPYYVASALLCIFLGLGLAWNLYREQQITKIASWPAVTAIIQSAQINQINTTSSGGPRWNINVDMTLSFTAHDTPIKTRYIESFTKPSGSEYAATLSEGKSIEIRYNPSNPNAVSLYPHLY